MFENLSLPHLLIVFAVVLLLFGAKRIPEIAGSMGKGIREFKKNIHEGLNELPANAPRVNPISLPRGLESDSRIVDEERREPRHLL
jgi:sec-independent protein translocase protein TatA